MGLSRSRKDLESSCRPDELRSPIAAYSVFQGKEIYICYNLWHPSKSAPVLIIVLLMIRILPRRETKAFDKQSYLNLIVCSDVEAESLQLHAQSRTRKRYGHSIKLIKSIDSGYIGRHVSHVYIYVPPSKMPFCTSSCIRSHHALYVHEKEQEHQKRGWRLMKSAYLAAVQPAMATARRTATA